MLFSYFSSLSCLAAVGWLMRFMSRVTVLPLAQSVFNLICMGFGEFKACGLVSGSIAYHLAKKLDLVTMVGNRVPIDLGV